MPSFGLHTSIRQAAPSHCFMKFKRDCGVEIFDTRFRDDELGQKSKDRNPSTSHDEPFFELVVATTGK
jgi:hypothetical protein